ncbi:MAG: hypothetical protein EAZ32_17785 [Cytophagia bacterium]|nr:MAG: hypothetical protein EAZ46_11345 [Runella sp.]TAG16629.1 MAG: hypothetical protein EAZ38_18510 [Cytophagales bacterium]TAG35905.1 MAG: hypothetical protein EAZ32_17785 [Cytophagia bacterium]TAG57426.1 MAG: hypothetical protein EAZ29_02130 [Runella slithyformis]TAG74840.1 MAG: hypothetical protein EAZ26_01635 [Runella slithyformis]
MTTTIELQAEELDYQLFKSLKAMFKGRKIRVVVDTPMDETDYLLASEANRRHLERSLAQLKNGEIIEVVLEELK